MTAMTPEERIQALENRVNDLEQLNPRNSTRYPYTYACDHIRSKFGVESRADASAFMREMASKLGQEDHRKIAEVFADAYITEHQL